MKKALGLATDALLGKLMKEISQTLGDYYWDLHYYKKAGEYYKKALQISK